MVIEGGVIEDEVTEGEVTEGTEVMVGGYPAVCRVATDAVG